MNNTSMPGNRGEAGRSDEATRNAERASESDRRELERTEAERGRRRTREEDLVLHDDDEAELDLPR
jgi:hypothetical protein